MRRNYIRVLLALLLLGAVHLRPVCRVTVDGQPLEGFYAPGQLRAATEAARETAEELLAAETELPVLHAAYRLHLHPADGSTEALTDALLRMTPGVTVADSVRVNGIPLGTVADGSAMLEQLRDTIRSDMPDGAAVGNLGGRLQVFPVYSRAGHECGSWDMILNIMSLAPVFYLDGQGRLV